MVNNVEDFITLVLIGQLLDKIWVRSTSLLVIERKLKHAQDEVEKR